VGYTSERLRDPAIDCLLISAEEEEFVFPNRTAYCSAKLISSVLWRLFPVEGSTARSSSWHFQQVVPDELEKISMELVRTGFRYRVPPPEC
jgi:hypothetical protein